MKAIDPTTLIKEKDSNLRTFTSFTLSPSKFHPGYNLNKFRETQRNYLVNFNRPLKYGNSNFFNISRRNQIKISYILWRFLYWRLDIIYWKFDKIQIKSETENNATKSVYTKPYNISEYGWIFCFCFEGLSFSLVTLLPIILLEIF